MTVSSRPAWAMYSNLQIKQAKVLDFWRGAEPAGTQCSGTAASDGGGVATICHGRMETQQAADVFQSEFGA